MERRRTLKLAFLSAAAMIAAGAVVLGVFIDRTASAPGLRPRLEEAASAFLGRPLTIGALEWRRWPSAMLVARNVRLYEDPLKRRLLAEAPAVEARVAVLSVFKLAAGITELRFVAPRVWLRRDKAGEWNAARIAGEIAARPEEPGRRWGRLAFNWFVVEGGTVTVEDEGGALGSLPGLAIDAKGKLRFGQRRLHFPFELAGRLERSETAVAIAGDLGGLARLRVEVKNGDLSLAGLAWPSAAHWNGRWGGTLDYDERPPGRWRLRARAAPLSVSTAAPRLDSFELTADGVLPASATFAAAARSSTTEIEVKGSASGGAVELDVKSPKADLDAVWAFARAAAAAAPGPSAAPRRLTATISADALRYGGADFRDVRAVVSRSTGPYALERLTFSGLGGTVSASGSYLSSSADDALKLAWKASGLGVQDLFRLAGSSLAAAGVADIEGRLETGSGARFLPALDGTVTVRLKNGWFGGVPGLLKVLARLNLATLFKEAAGHHVARVPFYEASGTVKIMKGRISADAPLVLKNETLEMAFMGTYDLPTQTVDGKVVVNFLTVTDEIIRLIPGVRDILLGEEKGMIPIWVKVTGKAGDPDVDVLSAKTIAAPFWNTMGHILKLPKTLFKKLKPPSR